MGCIGTISLAQLLSEIGRTHKIQTAVVVVIHCLLIYPEY